MTLRLPDRTGAAKMALGFARALRTHGYDLTLVHGTAPVDEPTILPDFAAIGARTVLEARLEQPQDPRLVRAMTALARRDGSRAVIGVNQRDRVPALQTASRVGVPGVLMVQNQHHFWGPRPVAAAKRLAYATAVRRLTTVAVCTSTVVRDEMTGFGVPADRCVVLPNGIELPPPTDLDAPRRAEVRSELGGGRDDLVLLNVGRLDPQKGQDLLLAGLGRPDVVRGVHVALVGSAGDAAAARRTDAYAGSLHRQVAELRLAPVVTFLGWRDDVRTLLAAADGYVHSARWEGPALPLAVMEAMAAGCPTIFTDCSGMPPEFTAGEHGLVARTGDPASLRRCVEDLAGMSPERRAAMGAAGADLIRTHYRVEDVADRFAKLIREVVDADPGRRRRG